MRLALKTLLVFALACRGLQAQAPLESTRLVHLPTVWELSLDGNWQAGLNRLYDRTLQVPGLATDPTQSTPGTLWYKRMVKIPAGQWVNATLTLKGARFAPEVYLNGQKVSAAEGGMAATIHRFALPRDAGGKEITLEIALKSLKELDPKDASAVPGADLWRNNNSSYLWDSVILRLHGEGEIERVTPYSDLSGDTATLKWELAGTAPTRQQIRFVVLDSQGKLLAESPLAAANGTNGFTRLDLHHRLQPWSPEHPHLYRLRTELLANGVVLDAREQSFGLREFAVKGKGFELNGQPYHLRMGTVVWHRWSRDPEAKEIAFDPIWFENNVVRRVKNMGGNAMRFHLGLPPEEFLDLCDRDGLTVQMEWPFFHGISASSESMSVQWRAWLDTAMRHPSVVVVHPWNETGGPVLNVAHRALDPLLALYPPMVVAHRDITPVHKYWWSLFENLGLYYDSAAQFDQAVMVDEFGGDYLDGNGNPGLYPATRETFLRFLGRDNTRDERLQLQADANARVAEYWRRLDVAGFSPFCILGSPQDGNHWYLGPSNRAALATKPVWSALSAAFAPSSLSLELWNRNFAPGETIGPPLWFFNDTEGAQHLRAKIHVIDATTGMDAVQPIPYDAVLKAHGKATVHTSIILPTSVGEWRIEARLTEPASPPAGPVVSAWRIRTFVPQPSALLAATPIAVPDSETELRSALTQLHLKVVAPSDASARVMIGSRATWKRLHDDAAARAESEAELHQGRSIVLVDVGPQPLGVGYTTGGGLPGGPLEGAPTVANPSTLETTTLFGGVHVSFTETAEPESTLQQAIGNHMLWQHVPREATWLWNGLRGGLIVPAADMQVTGLSGKALLSTWQARGADPSQIVAGHAFAYELAGYYAFAATGGDKAVASALRKRVQFLVEDAPALQAAINPNAPIAVTDLGEIYRLGATGGQAESLTPLANAGKNLVRTPVVQMTFGDDSGKVVLSQLLTAGRLLPGAAQAGPGVYGLRYDPVAVQFLLNMLDSALEH